MKRNGKVLNAKAVKAGRRMLRRMKKNYHWLAKETSVLLGRGAEFAADFSHAAKMTAWEGTITGLNIAILVKAAYDENAAAQLASEYSDAGWTQIVEAIRFIGSQ